MTKVPIKYPFTPNHITGYWDLSTLSGDGWNYDRDEHTIYIQKDYQVKFLDAGNSGQSEYPKIVDSLINSKGILAGNYRYSSFITNDGGTIKNGTFSTDIAGTSSGAFWCLCI